MIFRYFYLFSVDGRCLYSLRVYCNSLPSIVSSSIIKLKKKKIKVFVCFDWVLQSSILQLLKVTRRHRSFPGITERTRRPLLDKDLDLSISESKQVKHF